MSVWSARERLYRESNRLEASGQQPPRRSASPGLCDRDSIFDVVALMWPFWNWGHFDTAILKLWKISDFLKTPPSSFWKNQQVPTQCGLGDTVRINIIEKTERGTRLRRRGLFSIHISYRKRVESLTDWFSGLQKASKLKRSLWVIKIVWYWWKKRQTDQWDRTESSEQRPPWMSPTGLGQRSKGNTMEKDDLCYKWCRNNRT